MPSPDEPGAPLSSYRGQADVLLICEACTWTKVYPLEDVIAKVGEDLGIRQLARRTKMACPQCGRRKFEARPAFHGCPGSDGTRA